MKFTSNFINIEQSKIFTYPTRLANSWTAKGMEINLPGRQLGSQEIELTVCEGSTKFLSTKPRLAMSLGNFYRTFYRNFATPVERGEEFIYDSRYQTDANIAHALTNVAPRLLAAKQISPKITVVLRKKASEMEQKIYNLLGFSSLILTDKDVKGKIIVESDISQWRLWRLGCFSSMFGKLDFAGFNQQTPERVFISRRNSRCLINEDEVEQTLEQYGFKKVYFEDMAMSEKWSIARNAKIVVGIHGAALSCLVFNRNSVKVLELFHPGYLVELYRLLTNSVGGTWCGVTGQMPANIVRELDYKQKGRSFAVSSTKIDINSLCQGLDYLGVEKATTVIVN